VAGGDLGQGTRLAAVAGARICFEDEAGQSLRPGNARTWAPRGQTPVTRVSGNSGRLSVARVPCLKPDQPGRFSCRVRVRRRRKATGPSCPRPGYAALVTAAHRVTTPRPERPGRPGLGQPQDPPQPGRCGSTPRNSDWLTVVRSRLRAIQRRPGLINALLGQTGLSLEPPPP
jgi:hypothetical protein